MDKDIITNSPTSETTERATADPLQEGVTKELQISIEVKNGDSELVENNRLSDSGDNLDVSSLSEDGIKHDDSGSMDADMNLESISLTDEIKQADRGDKTDEEHNLISKVEEEKAQTTKENRADSTEHDVSVDLDSKAQEGLSSNDVEVVDPCEKINEEHNVKSKVEEEEEEEEETHAKHVQTGDIYSSIDLDSKFQQELRNNIEQVENMDKGNDLEGLSSNDVEVVDPCEKINEEHNVKSKVEEEEEEEEETHAKHVQTGDIYSSIDLDSKFQQELRNEIEQVENMDKGNDFECKELDQTTGENSSENSKNEDLGVTDRSINLTTISVQGSIDEGKNIPEKDTNQTTQENIMDKTNVPVVERERCISFSSLKADIETEEPVRPEKNKSFRNLVKNKSLVAVTNFLRAVSGKLNPEEERKASDSSNVTEVKKAPPKPGDKSAWNPLSFIIRDDNAENKIQEAEAPEPINIKGRIILYTRLGCQTCNQVRLFLYNKRLRYVEINIDVYPSRKLELDKFTGSCIVPKVFFNEVVIGGLSELKSLDESGKLDEKIEYLMSEEPAYEAPLPPLSGEDDSSNFGHVDELALIVRKMKESVVVKDRFFKMRRFSRCFVGSDAVNFLSQDQLLEKEEAVEFGRKLASKLFFQHVLQENLFEDGNHLYWFLDDIPAVSSQCHNIPRGISDVKPKPIRDIASRLQFLSSAIYEAYLSEDGKHVDYRTIHGSEEFARYLRIIQELQRVELQNMAREEKLAFFINLYNMMTIHAILVLGHPNGPTERRRLLGEFKYVMGGCSYSLSDIQNGILRCNQRLPFTLTKPFGPNDKRAKTCVPYTEPLIHFALVLGTRSGPPLRCYSPGNIDEELMDSARNFLRGGGLIVDLDAKVAHLTKLLKWFNVDFGKTEVEVLKHASNYLEPANSEALLELLANDELKVIYQHYDWGLNL